MDREACSRVSVLFITNLNMFPFFSLDKALRQTHIENTHRHPYTPTRPKHLEAAGTLHKTRKSKLNDLPPIDFHPQWSKMQGKVKDGLEKLGGMKKKRLQRYSQREKERGNIEGRGVCMERGRRDAHLWPVGQSRSAGVWGFDFPPGLHLCEGVCVYSVILISRQLCA